MDEVASLEPRVGEQAIPDRLDRLNPGAFLIAGLWTLVYGIWPWFFAFLAIMVLNIVVGLSARWLGGTGVTATVVREAISVAISVTLSAVFCFRANRLLWEKENRRIYTQEAPRAPELVSKFERDQRNWFIGGLVLMAYVVVAPMLSARTRTVPFAGFELASASVRLAVLGVLYAWDRSRRGRSVQS